MLLYQISASAEHEKIYKSLAQTRNLKYQCQLGMINSNYLMNYILYQIFRIILSISAKNMKQQLIILQ